MNRRDFKNEPIDGADERILKALFQNARISTADLARQVGLSPPTVAERIKRLEEAGVISGYRAQIDFSKLGRGLTLMIRARPLPGQMSEMIRAINDTPQIVKCERVSGEDCFIARAHVRDVVEMEEVIDRIVQYGATNSALVQSVPVPLRHLDLYEV